MALDLPRRDGPIPETTKGVPHVQIGVVADAELSEQLLRKVAGYDGVTLGPTRVSLPGAIGFQLGPQVPLVHPEAIPGGREFAHLHPDGSLHAALDPDIAFAAVETGWAVAHPWSSQRPGWEGFVMIFTPTTVVELEVVLALVQSSYTYVTGQTPQE